MLWYNQGGFLFVLRLEAENMWNVEKERKKELHGPMCLGYLYPGVSIHPMCQKVMTSSTFPLSGKKGGFKVQHKW